MDIYNYLKYPTKAERDEIANMFPIIKDLYLKAPLKNREITNVDDFLSSDTSESWIRLFNNRLGEIRFTYFLIMYYYNKGIPDYEWQKSSITEGNKIEYYPLFDSKDFYHKFYFDYYVDAFYSKFFSAIDIAFHMLNDYYFMGHEKGQGFRKVVLKSLKLKNTSLYKFVKNMEADPVYGKAKEFRNDSMHNFLPNTINSSIEAKKTKSGATFSFGIGKYTTSIEFKENIEQLITKLKRLIEEIEKHLA